MDGILIPSVTPLPHDSPGGAAGTKIGRFMILRKLGEGATQADLLDAYPGLAPEDIQSAIRYAADTVAHEETLVTVHENKP